MKKIMVIEDHKKIRDELCKFLIQNGYECLAPENFANIIELILSSAAQLILLDINLPVYDGYHICREIRKVSEVPIIVVTSRDTEIDELLAINLGADDFVTKPYNTQILLARIATVLKRAYHEAPPEKLLCGNFTVNLAKSSLEYRNMTAELTKNELKILTCLYEKKGVIVSRDELMRYLWDSELFIDDNTLTVNMTRLRRKLEETGLMNVIETRRGQGYIML
ncbi:response regulator with CheY-like receiver domain and winged-helix DNA-binding domain [Desulfosporosinus orientis DSM 765]|uniref:Stage 0 sporulation protein A homolog n=1 Tax=Desulfosporosinus orientis (strain ATCC 19365 / DSM 765 / NCIMB 8382 / VKM B-1628 / Singapore I) TaxID=768706 RepID=G7WAX0_DESOD|nr:response regulator transcription factor [Desulfosporosinus orientis]AET67181.1 response regulator with CheY-like receiver domain and winged-helix DNA-binding domain [Desulfosporosinus orientis DSM 765]